jgi:hypothetical protein
MEKRLRLAHLAFMVSFVLWIIVLAVTPVGGWHESNPWREYYMTAFSITSVLTLLTLCVWYRYDKIV